MKVDHKTRVRKIGVEAGYRLEASVAHAAQPFLNVFSMHLDGLSGLDFSLDIDRIGLDDALLGSDFNATVQTVHCGKSVNEIFLLRTKHPNKDRQAARQECFFRVVKVVPENELPVDLKQARELRNERRDPG